MKVMRSKTYQGKLLDSWNEGFTTGYDLGLKRRPQAEPPIQVDTKDWILGLTMIGLKYFGPGFLKAMGMR